MITLDIEEYCNDCPKFECDIESTFWDDFFGERKGSYVIRCANRDNCREIVKYIESKKE